MPVTTQLPIGEQFGRFGGLQRLVHLELTLASCEYAVLHIVQSWLFAELRVPADLQRPSHFVVFVLVRRRGLTLNRRRGLPRRQVLFIQMILRCDARHSLMPLLEWQLVVLRLQVHTILVSLYDVLHEIRIRVLLHGSPLALQDAFLVAGGAATLRPFHVVVDCHLGRRLLRSFPVLVLIPAACGIVLVSVNLEIYGIAVSIDGVHLQVLVDIRVGVH